MSEHIIDRVFVLLSQKRFSEANNLLNDLLRESPNDSEYLRLSSHIAQQLGDLTKALNQANASIAADPNSSLSHYTKCNVLLELDKLREAKISINKAILLAPLDADNYALLAHLYFREKQYDKALESANDALAFEPENLLALNTRSSALLKLGNHDESFKTIEGALREDPNDSNTHANYGWNLLESGDHKKALIHFSEALKNNPNSSFAQAGMMEALKARYVVYRWFLKYSFWISNLTSKNQWVVIIGFYVGYRIINTLAKSYPVLVPLSVLLMVIALSTWVITPISNLFLRLNKFGRHMLDKEEMTSSTLVGISLLVGLISGISFLFLDLPFLLSTAIFGVTMMIPLSSMFSNSKNKWLLPAYTVCLGLLGLSSILTTFSTQNLATPTATLYLLGFFAYQWVANFTIIHKN